MNQSTTSPVGEQQPPATDHRNAVWYCITLLAIPLAALVISLIVVRTDWFQSRSGNTYIPNVGFGAKLHHADCQVLITGDSSSLVGVIPAVIARETSLSTCNIAEFGGMEQVNGRMMIDEYLKNNIRPKFVVFVYVPENMSAHDTWTDVSHFEAILFRLRSHPDAAIIRSLLHHPSEAFSFITLSLRLTFEALAKKPMSNEVMHLREQNLGWIAVPGAGLTECLPGHSINPPNAAYINALRSQYGVQGTQVLVDLTPMPTCDPDYDYYAPKLAPMIDNQQEKYPVELYNNSGRLHLVEVGAERFSKEIALQIEQRQKSGSPTN